MTIEQLRETHEARPFQPFRIHMADGRHLDVVHPEFLAHSPSGRTISVATADESFEFLDLRSVTSLEPISDGTKGRRRKRSQ
jgi:hypothetical protein